MKLDKCFQTRFLKLGFQMWEVVLPFVTLIGNWICPNDSIDVSVLVLFRLKGIGLALSELLLKAFLI